MTDTSGAVFDSVTTPTSFAKHLPLTWRPPVPSDVGAGQPRESLLIPTSGGHGDVFKGHPQSSSDVGTVGDRVLQVGLFPTSGWDFGAARGRLASPSDVGPARILQPLLFPGSGWHTDGLAIEANPSLMWESVELVFDAGQASLKVAGKFIVVGLGVTILAIAVHFVVSGPWPMLAAAAGMAIVVGALGSARHNLKTNRYERTSR